MGIVWIVVCKITSGSSRKRRSPKKVRGTEICFHSQIFLCIRSCLSNFSGPVSLKHWLYTQRQGEGQIYFSRSAAQICRGRECLLSKSTLSSGNASEWRKIFDFAKCSSCLTFVLQNLKSNAKIEKNPDERSKSGKQNSWLFPVSLRKNIKLHF